MAPILLNKHKKGDQRYRITFNKHVLDPIIDSENGCLPLYWGAHIANDITHGIDEDVKAPKRTNNAKFTGISLVAKKEIHPRTEILVDYNISEIK